MSKHRINAIGLLFGLVSICAPANSNGQDRVTLYSINKYPGAQRVFCMNFRSGPMAYSTEPCDLRYGSLYAGNELDWLESSNAQGNRSVIKDLGLLNWDQSFTVSVVQPLPKLPAGEQRNVTIDVSGADGADGAPGAPARDAVDADGVLRPKQLPPTSLRTSEGPVRPKHDGKPRIDPMFVKAIAGHMYVIHVVHETDDFYVVFRVENVERGSYCTISWKMVPDPATRSVQGKK